MLGMDTWEWKRWHRNEKEKKLWGEWESKRYDHESYDSFEVFFPLSKQRTRERYLLSVAACVKVQETKRMVKLKQEKQKWRRNLFAIISCFLSTLQFFLFIKWTDNVIIILSLQHSDLDQWLWWTVCEVDVCNMVRASHRLFMYTWDFHEDHRIAVA